MSNVEQLVREALLRHEAEAPGLDPLGARPVAVRARRRQVLNVVGAGLVALVIALGSVSGLGAMLRGAVEKPATPGPTTPSPSGRVGFIGLPPEGATPSTPKRGDLVLAFWTSGTRIWVYADGRLIWVRHGDFPYGANPRSTGYLEQRLTPKGVELMRSEVISTGLFERDLVSARVPSAGAFASIEVRNGERLVRITFSPGGITEPEPEQAAALVRLQRRLTDPASWLPASAWEDPEIHAYVPSAFAISFSAGLPPSDPIRAGRILDLLPRPARDLLSTKHRSTEKGVHSYQVTTEEARALADAFDEAGYGDTNPIVSPYVLAYSFSDAPKPVYEVGIEFEPVLPHGEWTCSGCG